MSVFVLSLMGIPPLVGFVGKLYVFGGATGVDNSLGVSSILTGELEAEIAVSDRVGALRAQPNGQLARDGDRSVPASGSE